MKAGVSGAAIITRFDATLFRTQLACELKDFDASQWLDRADIKRTDLYAQYALISSDEALRDSGLDI
jgi:3-oxoacyl-[acyl-carrier-protein] synthase II